MYYYLVICPSNVYYYVNTLINDIKTANVNLISVLSF